MPCQPRTRRSPPRAPGCWTPARARPSTHMPCGAAQTPGAALAAARCYHAPAIACPPTPAPSGRTRGPPDLAHIAMQWPLLCAASAQEAHRRLARGHGHGGVRVSMPCRVLEGAREEAALAERAARGCTPAGSPGAAAPPAAADAALAAAAAARRAVEHLGGQLRRMAGRAAALDLPGIWEELRARATRRTPGRAAFAKSLCRLQQRPMSYKMRGRCAYPMHAPAVATALLVCTDAC